MKSVLMRVPHSCRSVCTALALAALVACGGSDAPLEVTPAVQVADVQIVNAPESLTAGESVQLNAVSRDSRGNELRDRSVTWSVAPNDNASISAQGVLAGVSPGTIIVTATVDTKSARATINVLQPRAATIEVRLASSSVVAGQSTTATAVAYDGRGGVIPGKRPNWTSSANSVASIDSTGVVTTVSAGTSIITASIDGQVGRATLTVTPVPVATIQVTNAPQIMVTGASVDLIVAARDAGGNVLTGRSISFSSSSIAVAQVSSGGTLTAISSGSATITATSEGISTSFALNVRERVASVALSSRADNLQRGRSLQLTALARDSAGRTIVGVPVTWTSSNPAVATVSGSGLVNAVGIGSVQIRARIEDKEDVAWISGWDTCQEEPFSIGMSRNGMLIGGRCSLWTAEPQASVWRVTASSLTFAPSIFANIFGLPTWGWSRSTPGVIGMEIIAPAGPVSIQIGDGNRQSTAGGFTLGTGLVVGDTVSCGGNVALLQGGAAARQLRTQDCSTASGHYFDILTVYLTAGRSVTFTMSSFSFDSYLEVRTGDGSGVLAFDDNSGGGTNARVRFTANTTGFYQIWARAATPFRTGQYTIETTQ